MKTAHEVLVEALKALLVNLPHLWGDYVIDGQLTLTVEEDAIYKAIDAIEAAGTTK